MSGTKKGIRGSGRVAFLARLEVIKKMVEAGHPLLSVYQEHEGDLSFSYSQFVKYVHKYITGKTPEKKASVVQAPEPKIDSSVAIKRKGGFTYDGGGENLV